MQHPAVPELAHTAARPVHWLATAAALAAVVAGSAVLQPDAATAAQTGPETRPRAAAGVAAPAPDPASVDFPLDCGTVRPVVKTKASGDLDGDGRAETVAVVHCRAGSGTPPDGVYVLTRPGTGKPRVVATLVDPEDRLNATGLAVREGAVTATLLGYSSLDVPRCCPDRKEAAKWQWKDGAFARTTRAGARSV
ncbi:MULTISPECIES: hypothetical protein [unclassified Streptomyces]|uniref:hypothetical protein n=1 Tax=unclassified Streptomyces TaxID=2593676 RepID=UPI00074A82D4|nr:MULTISPECIES: hypothetical protein [unclassified Streptomyces]KUL51583.1 hypothetical protein ADL30_26720 [Streptomyces sp. NRRL S-1521]THC50765.1 hypothetical protein E7X58_15495 [Streptomyces sp. A1499]